MYPYYSWILLFLTVVITSKHGVHSLECLKWISSTDGKYRSHCYQYHKGTSNSTYQAETFCKNTGGQLAPYVDEIQYRFWRHFLPPSRGETIIGLNDLVQESIWTSFDGTPVSDLPWNLLQPNGGRKQNCVVINAEPPGYSVGEPFKLQDKDCSESFDGFLCYKDALCHRDCEWGCRTDCFWFISNMKNWTFHGANAQCKEQDGVLASVTSLEKFKFLQSALLDFQTYTGMGSAWVGVHFIDSKYRNVNGDDFPDGVFNNISDPYDDYCLQLVLSDLTSVDNGQSSIPYNPDFFHPCDTARSMAGICIRSNHGFRWYTAKNSTSVAYIRNALQINKSETTTEIIKRSSASDGRASSTGLGCVGVSVILGVVTFVAILDCGKGQKIVKKRKRKRGVQIISNQPNKIKGTDKGTTKN